MVEGQGFLQWLSVYALTLSPEVDVVLLDEPDAHLNAALQKDMLQSLAKISQNSPLILLHDAKYVFTM